MYDNYPAQIRRLKSEAFTASSVTVTFASNQYKKIELNIDLNGGFINTVVMTGLTAGTYFYENSFANVATPGASGATAQNNWVPGATTGASSNFFEFSIFPAPAKKSVRCESFSGSQFADMMTGHSTDTVNDPTAIVIAFDASRTGYVYAIGYT